MTCTAWGHYSETDPIPQNVHAKGAAPILVVGTTGDPATPYHWAQALAKQLDSAQLLTWDVMPMSPTSAATSASPQPSTASSWTARCHKTTSCAPAESGRLPLIESCCLHLLARRQHDFCTGKRMRLARFPVGGRQSV